MHSQVTCGCTTRYTTRAAPHYCCCTAACSTSTRSSANCYPGNSTTRQPPRRPPETPSSTGLDDNISHRWAQLQWPTLGECLLITPDPTIVQWGEITASWQWEQTLQLSFP